jgi:hypothetical protein
MDNAKKLSPMFQVSVLGAEDPRLQSAEKSAFGIGPTKGVFFAILGGRMKPNGTAIGKTSFPLTGKRSSTPLATVNDTSRM